MRRLILLAMLAGAPAAADPACRALDGDTLACGAERIRIIGLDAPETHGQCEAERELARLATERLAALITEGIEIQRRGQDRFGRTLARARSGERDVAETLIAEGLARAYDGRGRRAGWCE
jgi:micrococcal nuclease